MPNTLNPPLFNTTPAIPPSTNMGMPTHGGYPGTTKAQYRFRNAAVRSRRQSMAQVIWHGRCPIVRTTIPLASGNSSSGFGRVL
jgi:hypothetical protein